MANSNLDNTLPLLAPDLVTQQDQLKRRQALVDALRAQAFNPQRVNEIGGRVVPFSIGEGVTQLLAGYLSNRAQERIDADQAALGAQRARSLNALFGGTDQPPISNGAGNDQVGQVGGADLPSQASTPYLSQGQQVTPQYNQPMQNVTPPQPARAPQSMGFGPAGMPANQRALAYALSPEGYVNATLDQYKPTEAAKDDTRLNIPLDVARRMRIAKMLKEGTLEMAPGSTALFPNGDSYSAPDFKTGVQGGFDANGQPIMSAIPGSEVLAGLKGQEQRAARKHHSSRSNSQRR